MELNLVLVEVIEWKIYNFVWGWILSAVGLICGFGNTTPKSTKSTKRVLNLVFGEGIDSLVQRLEFLVSWGEYWSLEPDLKSSPVWCREDSFTNHCGIWSASSNLQWLLATHWTRLRTGFFHFGVAFPGPTFRLLYSTNLEFLVE